MGRQARLKREHREDQKRRTQAFGHIMQHITQKLLNASFNELKSIERINITLNQGRFFNYAKRKYDEQRQRIR